MNFSATRSAPFAVALLLGCTALSSAANAGWFDFGSSAPAAAKDAKPSKDAKDSKDTKEAKAAAALPGQTLDDSVREAQMLRLAGSYPEAIKHLSQLMMVAADDSRVVSEYGKTLAAMGRAQDAVSFLTRAQQLQPGDWTIYSALGVAYDQLGNHKDAQTVYEHALAIKPGEPSVLNNYALSRMLAKDPEMARKLAARAEIGGGASDAKIARNITMIRTLSPEAPDTAHAGNTPAPHLAAAAPQAAPRATVTSTPIPLANLSATPVATATIAAPRPQANLQTAPVAAIAALRPQASLQTAPAPIAAAPRPQITANASTIEAAPAPRVVMQRVPVDPLAGPVSPATHAPRPLQTQKAEAPKPAVKTAASQAEDLQARADAIAKQLTNKPAAIAAAKTEANKEPAAKTEANKVQPAKPVVAKAETAKEPAAKSDANKLAEVKATKDIAPLAIKPVPGSAPHVLAPTVKTAEAKPAPAPGKSVDVKAGPAPHVLPPAPVKTAEAKPVAPVKTAARPKDVIPGLRMSANAY